MAKKSSKSASKTTRSAPAASTKVTRITASDAPVKKDTSPKKTKKIESTNLSSSVPSENSVKNPRKAATDSRPKRHPIKKATTPFTLLFGYFKGAWYELRQVRWPNRRATWGLTGALIGFTLFFVILILLLDGLFKYIFELILK